MFSLSRPISDDQLEQRIIQYAFSHYQRRGTVSADPLNKSLTQWMKAHKDGDRLNEIFNRSLEAIKETNLEAYEFMNRMFRFGCIHYWSES